MADAFWARTERDVVEATGPEAAEFLQGQLSQDVAALSDGAHAWSWLLAPNGKVDALVRVTRGGAGQFYLDTDAGWGDAVAARLLRFRLRTKVELSQVAAPVVAVRGEGQPPAPGAGHLLVEPAWPGQSGADVICVDGRLPDHLDGRQATSDEYERWRVSHGVPRMGCELDERTIPAETGLVPVTVSFTKGCYTGQELVARIDSRGSHVARRLARLASSQRLEAGAALSNADGTPAGLVTSAVADGGRFVALGYVRRGVEPGSRVTAGADGAPVEVVALVAPGPPTE